MTPCPTCQCATKHARRSTAPYRLTPEHVATCWDWSHTCYAKRPSSHRDGLRAGDHRRPGHPADTDSDMTVCRCCKRERDVFPDGLDAGMCEPCAMDPALAFAQCKHGDA